MTKRSTLLKVVAIIMIVLSAIATLMMIASIGTLSAALAALGATWDDIADICATMGLSYTGPILIAFVIATIACVIELVVGILGLALKSKNAIFIAGVIVLILQVVSLILAVMTGTFGWSSFTSFILPILYVIGAKMCVQ